jgi:trimeric autotransporter adhesin
VAKYNTSTLVWECGNDLQGTGAGGTGTVTSIATGAGLSGGPITTTGTINLASTQLLPTTACAANQIPKWNGTSWACAADATSTGTATNAWVQGGNAFGAPGVLGTTDAQNLSVRAGGAAISITAGSGSGLRVEERSLNFTSPTVTNGAAANIARAVGSTVAGGGSGVLADCGAVAPADCSNNANEIFSTVSGGIANKAMTFWSTIGGGVLNRALGNTGTIAGGSQNLVEATFGFIGGGSQNKVSGSSGVIAGGQNNTADVEATVGGGTLNGANAKHATIGGGYRNLVGEASSTIAGGGSPDPVCIDPATGFANVPCGDNYVGQLGGFIGGGFENLVVVGRTGVIVGGEKNFATGRHTTVVGGFSNSASGAYGFIGGGRLNSVSSSGSVVAGFQNTASALDAIVGGGQQNNASGALSTIAGGGANIASGYGSSVGGGFNNDASGTASTIPGGDSNLASGGRSFAAGVKAKATHDNSFVFGANAGGPTGSSGNSTLTAFFTNGYFLYGGTSAGKRCFYIPDANNGWQCVSDRDAKTNISLLNGKSVLNKLLAMPVSSWSFKGGEAYRQIGPMAQDFFAAFKLGDSDKAISAMNMGGVALAAIQGLNQKLIDESKAKDAKISALEKKAEKFDALERAHDAMQRELAAIKKKLGL